MLGLLQNKKGFTLIELLVVISIISLLSTTVMASLNSARDKAKEAAIKTDLLSIKTQAELSYNKLGDYSGVAAEITPILNHINANGGTAALSTLSFGGFDYYDHYAVSVKFNSNITKNWSISDQYGIVVWDKNDLPIQITQMNWSAATTTCATPVGGIAGRLPTVEELKALYDAYGVIPPNFLETNYWSGSTLSDNSSRAWIVYITSGSVTNSLKTSNLLVRCVR